MKFLKSLSIIIVGAISMFGVAYAATQSFTANIQFLEPLSFNTVVNPNLGNWNAGASGRNFSVDTTGTAGGTDITDYINNATAGSVNVVGSASDTVDIVASNIVANGGVSIAHVPCNYGGAGEVNCDVGISTAAAPTTGGTALLLGVEVNTTTAHVDGDTAAPTFDIVVTYN